MNGWMDGYMYGWVGGCVDERTDGWMYMYGYHIVFLYASSLSFD